MNFFDQYQHPNWQKKRLEVLEAAEFTCERCFDSDTQLHVHHKRYIKGRKVWEYDREELSVLCDSCHATAHTEKEVLQALITLIPICAIPEITALIANYCADVDGPCRGGDFTEFVKDTEESPIASAVGKAAAVISNQCTIQEIHDFSEKLSKSDRGSSVSIRVKPLSGGFYA